MQNILLALHCDSTIRLVTPSIQQNSTAVTILLYNILQHNIPATCRDITLAVTVSYNNKTIQMWHQWCIDVRYNKAVTLLYVCGSTLTHLLICLSWKRLISFGDWKPSIKSKHCYIGWLKGCESGSQYFKLDALEYWGHSALKRFASIKVGLE